MLKKLIAVAAATLLAAAAIAVTDAPIANAESTNVTSNCSTLTVSPNGFASRGEVRVVIDGEVQTNDSSDGWQSFSGSFTGVYRFDPTLVHTFSVEINSFGADSAGRAFSSGTGFDSTTVGPTVACTPVAIRSAASNCVSQTAAAKQSIDLTMTGLRTKTTYLTEVIDDAGQVVKHFEFRTAPSVSKSFSGLEAGSHYEVRLTDETDDSLSGHASITIPGCAGRVALTASVGGCQPGSSAPTVIAELTGLIVGRGYTVSLAPASGRTPPVSFVAESSSGAMWFSGVSSGSAYSATVSDDAAPRSTSSGALLVVGCSAAGPESTAGPVSAALRSLGAVALSQGLRPVVAATTGALAIPQLSTLPFSSADESHGAAGQSSASAGGATLRPVGDAAPVPFLALLATLIAAALILLVGVLLRHRSVSHS